MARTEETPTAVQLGVTPSRMLLRGLVRRCPACGGGSLFRRWFTIVDRCPTCSLRFEREEGALVGYVGINVIVSFSLTFVVLLAGTLITQPDIPVGPLIAAGLVPALAVPLLFFPSSRTVWTAVDLIMKPLLPGEIDPRFVRVDPDRDSPPAP